MLALVERTQRCDRKSPSRWTTLSIRKSAVEATTSLQHARAAALARPLREGGFSLRETPKRNDSREGSDGNAQFCDLNDRCPRRALGGRAHSPQERCLRRRHRQVHHRWPHHGLARRPLQFTGGEGSNCPVRRVGQPTGTPLREFARGGRQLRRPPTLRHVPEMMDRGGPLRKDSHVSAHDGCMHSVRLLGPRRFAPARVVVPGQLEPDEVLIKLELAGICGSDKPGFMKGVDETGRAPVGFPAHECVGTVVRASSDSSLVGRRVIAIPNRDAGLSEFFVAPMVKTHALTSTLPLRTLILAQPLATVLAALDRLEDVASKRVAVIGLGPIGLSFGYVLSKMGVASLVGFDRRDRSTAPFADVFDCLNRAPTADDQFDLVIEAVGHDLNVVNTAIEAAAFRGTVLYCGVPDEEIYPFHFKRFFRSCLHLIANVQPDWQIYLPRAEEYLVAHPDLGQLVTDVIPIEDLEGAFEIAFTTDETGHAKVLISVDAWLDTAE